MGLREQPGLSVAPKGEGSRFATTRWSVVLDAQRDNATPALEALCRTYWPPLYAYARRRGDSPHDAEDLTQSFFARLLEKDYLRTVERQKGRFRQFLLMAFKRFLANEWDRQKRLKRGGDRILVSLDAVAAERLYRGDAPESFSADAAFERRWALSLLDRALARLRAEFETRGEVPEFEILKPCLMAERGAIAYSDIGEALVISEGAARVAVHRLRKRFRQIFREEIAQTVASESEIEEEVRHLIAVLA
jgi:RNA polymerase sigma-70 factor (ECF subfamily)